MEKEQRNAISQKKILCYMRDCHNKAYNVTYHTIIEWDFVCRKHHYELNYGIMHYGRYDKHEVGR